jgi:hypothetical protein
MVSEHARLAAFRTRARRPKWQILGPLYWKGGGLT